MEDSTARKHPKGLPFLFFTEMWERFGYYLMLGILFLYMTDTERNGLGFDSKTAADIFGTFIAMVYLTPFIGGMLADRLIGYRLSVNIGCVLMGLGYLGLAIPDFFGIQEESVQLITFYSSLGMIIIGTGFFKANISTLLGNLYSEDKYRAYKDTGFNIFYMGINIGAFICNFFGAYLRNTFTWGHAFAAAGIGMFAALIFFLLGDKHYRHADVRKPARPGEAGLGSVLSIIMIPAVMAGIAGWLLPPLFAGNPEFTVFGSHSTDAFLFGCLPILVYFINLYRTSTAEDKRPIGALLAIMGVVVIFWAVFKQNGTALTLWAENYTDRELPAAIAPATETLGMVKKVTTETKEVPAYDALFRAPKDEKGKVITKQDVTPYLNNLPKEKWPQEGKSLSLISTELFQSINPFFVIVLTPIVIAFFSMLRRRNREPSTPAKIAWGLVISACSTLVMVAAAIYSHNGAEKSSAWWLVGTYAVITAGELFLSPMGLSLVSKLSPPRIAALMMGAWSLSTSIGNKLSGVLASMWDGYDNKQYFFLVNFGLLMFAALGIFLMLPWLRRIINEHTPKT
ncbi:MAG: MFS transporter [Sphingobacteriales bacterium]|nr:MAG: MFS transporter [Sphingobacteriales bacterium]